MTIPTTRFPLIDVHTHYVADSYITAVIEAGHQKPDRMPDWPRFSVGDELATANLDKAREASRNPTHWTRTHSAGRTGQERLCKKAWRTAGKLRAGRRCG